MALPKVYDSDMKHESGFTLLEIVIATAILTIIAGLGLVISINFYKSQSLTVERDTVVSLLRKARSQALTNFNQSAHGLYIDESQYIIFQGSSFAGRSVEFDQSFGKAPNISASGLSEVVFSPLTAIATASGTIDLTNGLSTSTIFINYEGRIDW